ncbi:hypothetical protein ACX1Q6_002244 [Enterococcus hirae]|uniref:hypothetical protein n=1 Tax=Enterococcus hirae TaxID=1354 RepID=UPI0009C1083A|nr:hypothetical protein [Enterococcus hirae]EMF0521984.1 hypothetical protein [Enterococcus hirae]OQO52372.1 hypothetical protein BH734_09225 [Enterococcus hirae]BDX48165.1 hypothetical protein L6E_25790 [Enterococcus hirae]
MFKIAFYLLDLRDNSFKKVYFKKWEENIPRFTNKKKATLYLSSTSANQDIEKLKKAESPTAKTLSIKSEEAE